jgi:hypothetical protein
LLVSSTTVDDVIVQMNAVLLALKNYFDINKLMLNVGKTECLFPYEGIATVPAIHYSSHRLAVVPSFKYLGVHIDHMLTWKVHVDHIINKVKCRIYMMYRSQYCCCTAGRKLLFTAMILPHFVYCIEAWRGCSQTLGSAVELLYRHCIRIVLNDTSFKPRLSNTLAYSLIGMLPLTLDFQLRCASLLFAIVKLNTVPNLRHLFRRRVTERSTRESHYEFLLQIPFTRSERERSAFSWWGCILWSRIPLAIRSVSSMNEFRLQYTQYLLRQLNSDANLNRKFYDFV